MNLELRSNKLIIGKRVKWKIWYKLGEGGVCNEFFFEDIIFLVEV